MNEEIEKIFQGQIVVDKRKIPVVFAEYSGKNEDFVVYHNTGSKPVFCCDDEEEYSNNSVEFSVYTKGNYLNIVKKIKEKMKENNYDWIGDEGDLYEPDTKYHHIVIMFEKIRRI